MTIPMPCWKRLIKLCGPHRYHLTSRHPPRRSPRRYRFRRSNLARNHSAYGARQRALHHKTGPRGRRNSRCGGDPTARRLDARIQHSGRRWHFCFSRHAAGRDPRLRPFDPLCRAHFAQSPSAHVRHCHAHATLRRSRSGYSRANRGYAQNRSGSAHPRQIRRLMRRGPEPSDGTIRWRADQEQSSCLPFIDRTRDSGSATASRSPCEDRNRSARNTACAPE